MEQRQSAQVGDWAQGPQYNHRMMSFLSLQLDRVKQLEKPPSASAEEWECFHLAVEKGRRLLTKHERSFDIRTFYKIEDAHSAVDKICQYLKEQTQDWQVGIGIELESRMPQDGVDEDRKYLHGLLAYILKGIEDGVDDAVLLRWLPIRHRHEEEMRNLQIIGEDALVLGNKIGEGGYGIVYEATWGLSRVAVKTPRTIGDLPIEEFASLIKEVMVHAKLNHPNVAQVFATTPSGWLVMQAADTDLGTMCHRRMRQDWCGTLNLVREAAKGLCYLHCLSPPVVHSDVKPSNFLVFGKEPSSCDVKVTDFGLAFEVLEGNSKSARQGGGTLEWLAPEVYDNKPISILSDIFSFGVIMYEAVTGACPYGADQLSHYAKAAVVMNKKLSDEEPCMVEPEDCPKEMHALMRRCCSTDPAKRPTMLEVCEYLQKLPNTWRPSSQHPDEDLNRQAPKRHAGPEQVVLQGHTDYVYSLTVMRDWLFSGSQDSTIRVWTLGHWQTPPMLLRGHAGRVDSLAANQELLFSGSADCTVRAWTLESWNCVHTFEGHSGWVRSLVLTENHLFSGSSDQTIRAWSLSTWECDCVLQGHTDYVRALAINNRFLFSSSYDRSIRVWGLQDKQCQRVLEAHTHWVLALAVHGSYLCSGGTNGIIRVWSLVNWECVQELRGHRHRVRSLLVRGDLLFSASEDGTVRAWKLGTWECVRVLDGHASGVNALAAADEWLFSGSHDCTIRLWPYKELGFALTHSMWGVPG